MSLTKVSYSMINGAVFNVLDYGAGGAGQTDDTNAIQSAINAAHNAGGGTVFIPQGTYNTTSAITIPYQGISLVGAGKSASNIHATHTGNAIIDLTGGVQCMLQDLQLTSDSTTYPKTGIILARSSANGAGFHIINNIYMILNVTYAGIYSIASENNNISNVYCRIQTGHYGFYTSGSNDLSIGTSYSSTNTSNRVECCNFIMESTYTSGDTPLYIVLDVTAFWTFSDCYLVVNGNYYVCFYISGSGDFDCCINFNNVAGEQFTGATNCGGIYFTSGNSSTRTLKAIKFLDSYFNLISSVYAVYVEPSKSILLQDFEYQDFRTFAPANVANQVYEGLLNSTVGSASGYILVTGICTSNIFTADLRNNSVRATDSESLNIGGNTVIQFTYEGMPNGTTVSNCNSGPLNIVPMPGGGYMPLQRPTNDAEILPSDVVITNAGDTANAVYNLPKAVPGNKITFVKIAQYNIRIQVETSSGDLIYNATSTGYSYVENNAASPEQYSFIQLLCVKTGSWIPIGSNGTWTFTNTP